MPTTDRTATDHTPDATPDGLAGPEPVDGSSASTTPTRSAAITADVGDATSAAGPSAPPVRAATPGPDHCPHCGTATINCHGRHDCPSCTWTEARSTK